MTDINSVVLVGRVTRGLGERDFAYTQGGTARLNFSIAVNRSVKSADGEWVDEASFFDVTVWGTRAESLKQYMAKGLRVAVCGRLQQDRWKDGQGNSRSKVFVVANSVQLFGGKGANAAQPAPQEADAERGGDFPEDFPF